jgi:hypothetical protein
MANSNNVPDPVLSLPPLQYDVQYMDMIVRQLNYYMQQHANPGGISGTTLSLSELPTSSTGLPSGSVWVDTAAGNVLKIAP